MNAQPEGPWLLLIHQLPAEPGYNRVRIWRRLQRLGAVQVKSSVWGLPAHDESLEDFLWLAREIEDAGGDAMLCEATFVSGLPEDVSAALARAKLPPDREGRADIPRSPGVDALGREELQGRVWVTRRGVQADRVGSAWLIRRYIDASASFKFVDESGGPYSPSPVEVRFDMYDAEFSHQGDACTFEVLASRFVSADPAVAAIAELVHDIDLKDAKFARPETKGVRALLLDGVCHEGSSDERRLQLGFILFDMLHAAFGGIAHAPDTVDP